MRNRVLQHATLVGFSALTYWALFKVNQWAFSTFDFSTGVSWVFLPSGLRLVLVLLFGLSGAAGIALATTLISLSVGYLPTDVVTAVVTGLISGFAPWLAWRLCRDWAHMDTELSNLTSKGLALLSIVFALTSAVLHQLWFVWRGLSHNWLTDTMVMAIGDWVGTVLILALSYQLLRVWRKPSPNQASR